MNSTSFSTYVSPAVRRLISATILLMLSLPASAQPLPNSAENLFGDSQYQELVERYPVAIARKQADARLLYLLGRSYYHLQEYSTASQLLASSVELCPDSSSYHLWHGRAIVQQGLASNIFKRAYLAPRARGAFEKAVLADPMNRVARHDLLRYYLLAPGFLGGNMDRARQQARILREIDEWEGYKAFCTIYLVSKDFQQAEAEILQALQKYPSDIQFYRFLATVYQESRQYEKLVQTCYRAIEVFPQEKNEWQDLARQVPTR